MQVREVLTKYQAENRLTDAEMGEKLGYSRAYYNKVRNGRAEPGDSLRQRLEEILGQSGRRTALVERKTGETDISLELNLDGSGRYTVETGIYMFDHMLSQVARHGRLDLTLKARGDDPHHLIEDVAICLGKALQQALGENAGIVRMGDATVPLDDALSTVAIDLSGRPYFVLDLSFSGNDMAGFSTDLLRHFLETFAIEGRLNLHARILYGTNDHHRAESLFKALGRALDMATRTDERLRGTVPSTKGTLERSL
jgi:imidazoleglycerol-phosphate dehydratase